MARNLTMSRRHRVSVVGLVALAACGPTGYVRPFVQPLTRPATQVAAPFDSTWSAVIGIFAAKSIGIRTIEKASGIIVAELATVGFENRMTVLDSLGNARTEQGVPVTVPMYADCGLNYVAGRRVDLNPTDASFTVFVTPSAAGSALRVTMRYRTVFTGALNAAQTAECQSTGRWESELEELIQRTVTGSQRK